MKQLMNFCFLFFGSFVYIANTQGQDVNIKPLEKQKESAVYFASGSAELSSKALESLTIFLEEKTDLEETEFRLQAFTDDVGSPERNALLAQKRAAQVQEYLSQQGISINTIKIQAFQQLHLNPAENVADQRANNRRVVVELWGISKVRKENFSKTETLKFEDFFNQDPKEYQQNFSFSADKGSVLEGEKGTVLQIPANCFVDSRGNVVTGEISFLLQEAYSYSDMLFQNLSTVSDGKILETGGMLFIEAKDTAGNVLAIREGAEITAAMASTAAKMPEMQTFEGELDSITKEINWVATNQPLLTNAENASNARPRQVSTNRNRLYQKSNLDERLTGLKKMPVWEARLPKEVKKPRLRLRLPKSPRLYALKEPNKVDLKTKMPQSPSLSNAEYNGRIRKKFQKLQSAYRKRTQKNQARKNSYKKDSIRYERALVKHKKNTSKYQEYNEAMRLVLGEMQENMTNFHLGEYKEEYDDLRYFSKQFRQKNIRMSGGKKYVADQINNNSIYDTVAQKLQAQLKNIDLVPFTTEEVGLLEVCWSKKTNKKLSNYLFKTEYTNSKFRINKHRINNIFNRAAESGNLKSYHLRQIRKMKTTVGELYNYKKLLKVDEKIQSNKQKVLPLVTRFLNMEKAIIDLEKAFLEVRTELNILNSRDMVNIYGNGMRIRSAGWLNCDRFMQGGNMTELEIITGYTENTCVIVVSGSNIRSLLSAIPNQTSFTVPQIPKSRIVKIIGIRQLGDNVEVFVEEGTVQSLKGVKPTFKKKTVEEVKDMMLAI